MSTTRQNPRARKFPAIEYRLATVDDVEQLIDAIEVQWNEAGYKHHMQWSRSRVRDYLTTAIGTGYEPYILGIHGDCIAGYVSYHLDHTFSDPPLAVMGELFAFAFYRRSPIGRALVTCLENEVKAKGVEVLHIPITSEHAAVRTLINMFTKFGAVPIGIMMRKVL